MKKSKHNYKYIEAYGLLCGSLKWYIETQVALAQKENAPLDAIYKRDDIWIVADAKMKAELDNLPMGH